TAVPSTCMSASCVGSSATSCPSTPFGVSGIAWADGRPVRRRITFAIVGTVIAALVIAGAGTFVLDRLSARETTRRELERQAQSLVSVLDETTTFRSLLNPTGTVPATAVARQAEIRRIVNRIKGLSNLTEEDI